MAVKKSQKSQSKKAKSAPKPVPLGPARKLTEQEQKLAERSPCFKEFCEQWRSPVSLQLLKELQRIAKHKEPIMILGPTGSGKTTIARCIHQISWRGAAKDMMEKYRQVNMGSLSPDLLRSELFGHRRGAFTGAERDYKGLILAANGGTLFLDEVADADVGAQASLLRFLESGKIRPVGCEDERDVSVRIVSATNKDPKHEVHYGVFRQDLYYRLAAAEVEVPPLHERIEDIEGIAPSIVAKLVRERYADDPELCAEGITLEAIRRLQDFGENWTGNIRQLDSVLVAAFINAGSKKCIEVEDLPPEERWHGETRLVDRKSARWAIERYLGTIDNQELMRDYARALLVCAGGNKHQAARNGKIAVTTLTRWLAIPEEEEAGQEERPAVARKKATRATGKKSSSEDAGVLV